MKTLILPGLGAAAVAWLLQATAFPARAAEPAPSLRPALLLHAS